MSVIQVTEPAVEPVTYTEAKSHLNVEHDDDSTLIQKYIKAARRIFEDRTRQTLVQRTFDYSFRTFCNKIELPRSPVISITSITYTNINTSPQSQTASSSIYQLNNGVTPSYVYLAYNQSWPSNRNYENDITIRFVAGYNDLQASPRDYADGVPDDIKVCILTMVAEMYNNREVNNEIQLYENDFINSLMEPHVLYKL